MAAATGRAAAGGRGRPGRRGTREIEARGYRSAGGAAARREPALPPPPRRAAADRVAGRGRLRPARRGRTPGRHVAELLAIDRGEPGRRLPRRPRPAGGAGRGARHRRSRCWARASSPTWPRPRPPTPVLEVRAALGRPCGRRRWCWRPSRCERLEELGLPLADPAGRPRARAATAGSPQRDGGDLVGPVAAASVEQALAELRDAGPGRRSQPRAAVREDARADPARPRPLRREGGRRRGAQERGGVRRAEQLRDACLPVGQAPGAGRLRGPLPGKYGPGLRRRASGSRWSSTPRICR